MHVAEFIRRARAGEIPVGLEHVESAQREAGTQGIPINEALVRLGVIGEADLLETIGRADGRDVLDLTDGQVHEDAVSHLPPQIAMHYHVAPVRTEGEVLIVATADPFADSLADELGLLLDRPVQLVLASADAIARAVRKHYGVAADTLEQMVASEKIGAAELGGEATADLSEERLARQASVVKLVNQILADAIGHRATDIHFEPFEDELRVRYRVDGVLHEAGVPPAARHFRAAVVSRIKVMSSLDIAEKRLPQDGRAQVLLGGENFDLRVSILPTAFGEAANIRILPRSGLFMDLTALGIEGRDLAQLRTLIERPHGILLVTGPTGSGKTTTLYTCLAQLNRPGTKILTIEDPIEYRMRGLVQMQVHPAIDFTFARALRSMLRHDPDAMLIGEIRDLETAEIAIRTALTGHLVCSTLHTNDAAGAITRLLDMGLEPFLLASSLDAILGQRLVRMVCSGCMKPYDPPPELLTRFAHVLPPEPAFVHGEGCRACRFTGFQGRTAITELLVMSEQIREMTVSHRHAADIKQAACKAGMQPLIETGMAKAACGLTAVDEVLRVSKEE